MYEYKVTLSPRPGTPGGNLHIRIRADSIDEARRIAEAQFAGYRAIDIQRVS